MNDRFDEELRHAAGPHAREPLPDGVLDPRLDEAPSPAVWPRPVAALAAGTAVALAALIGLGQLAPDAGRPSPSPAPAASVPTDDVMRERMRMLTADRGMAWRAEPPDTWVGTAPDAELTLVGAPVTDAILVVPAGTAEEAFEAVIRYNVAIEAMIEAPPGLARGWVENELDQWTGARALDTSLNEFGFDARMVSSGEPRVVTLTLHRSPGAWTFEPCQGASPVEPTADQVLVYFTCEPPPAEPRAVVRIHPGVDEADVRMRFAIEQLLEGPTEQERELGYSSVLGSGSGELLMGVELSEDGLAIIDLDRAILRHRAPNTSAQMQSMNVAITRTVRELADVVAIEIRIGGSCGAYVVWMSEIADCLVGGAPRDPSTAGEWWTLDSAVVDGESVPLVVSIIAGADRISGFVPCIQYEMQLAPGARSATISELHVTERVCTDTAGPADQAYLAALRRVTSVQLGDDELLLRGPGVELRFRR